jgi:FKBP-type peptidyl-prolyl cis-trans isomerase FkpA
MNKIHKLFFILTIGILFASCSKKDDAANDYVIRDYAVQYADDIAEIDGYLDSHYMTVDADYNVTITEIPTGGTQPSIRTQYSVPDESGNPVLPSKIIKKNNVDYKVYYIKLREGVNESPTAVDSVYVSYKGNLVKDDTQFDYAPSPVWFQLEGVVSGWAEIIPLFKTGNYDGTPGPNPVVFSDFGAGVMFLPSGLAYYNSSPSASVPAYSPLIFSFKLYKERYRDHDRDGIWSKYEINPNLSESQNPKDYDSDGDGIPNMYDRDDDGDHYLTKIEIKKPTPLLAGQGTSLYYPFNPILDNPLTTGIDESEPKGIPSKDVINTSTGEPDGTTPTRLRRHLDPSAKPPYTVY